MNASAARPTRRSRCTTIESAGGARQRGASLRPAAVAQAPRRRPGATGSRCRCRRHDALDSFAAAELELDAQRRRGRGAAVGRLARSRAGLAQHPARPRARDADRACRRADGRRGEDHELVGEPAAHDHVGVALPAFDEAEVDVEGATASMTSLVLPMTSLRRRSGWTRFHARAARKQVLADREARGDAQRRQPFARQPAPAARRLLEQRSVSGSSARPCSLSSRRRPTRSNRG